MTPEQRIGHIATARAWMNYCAARMSASTGAIREVHRQNYAEGLFMVERLENASTPHTLATPL